MIVRLIITAVAAYLLPYVLNGVHISGFSSALIFALVLGLLNLFVKPILSLFTLPITILTLGLFSLVINAIIILMADYFLDGIKVDEFLWALIFSVALSFLTSILGGLFEKKD